MQENTCVCVFVCVCVRWQKTLSSFLIFILETFLRASRISLETSKLKMKFEFKRICLRTVRISRKKITHLDFLRLCSNTLTDNFLLQKILCTKSCFELTTQYSACMTSILENDAAIFTSPYRYFSYTYSNPIGTCTFKAFKIA